jgi:uncharacterized protein with beta-barrel porin domain
LSNGLEVGEERIITVKLIPSASTNLNNYTMTIESNISLFAQDANPSNDVSLATLLVKSNLTVSQYAQALLDALGQDSSRLNQVVNSLSAYCAIDNNFASGLGGHCDDLYHEALNGNGAIIKRVLKNLRPREVVQQAKTSTEIISTQQANIATRLSQLRAGYNQNKLGLNINHNNKSLPLHLLSYLSDSDSREKTQMLSSPWGFFINGRISTGDYSYADASDEGFDFDSDGITAGVDYRVNNKFVAGLALGYANFDSNVGTELKMNSQSTSLSFYASYNPTNELYIDARLSYGEPEFNQLLTPTKRNTIYIIK